MATPTAALAWCEQGFSGVHVRPLPHEFRGYADRQLGRQHKSFELETRQTLVIGAAAREHRQAVLGLRKRFFESRHQCLRLRKLRLLREHVCLGHSACFELPLHHAIELGLLFDHVLHRRELLAQRGNIEGRRDDIAGERQICRFELPALVVALRPQLLELAPRCTEQINAIGNVDRRIVEREGLCRDGRIAECNAGQLLALYLELPIGSGQEQRTALGDVGVMRRAQRCLCGLHVRTVAQRLAHELIQWYGLKQAVPVSRDIPLCNETLRIAAAHGRILSHIRRRALRVVRGFGRRRRVEIRAHGAARDREERCGRQQICGHGAPACCSHCLIC